MKGLAFIGTIALALLTLFISPIISFWLFYFSGWIVSVAIGPTLVTALNLVFNTTYFTVEMIPWIAAVLGWIGGYFKTTPFTKHE